MPVERCGKVARETDETRIQVDVNLDGSGKASVETGVGMLDHLVSQIARHGALDITVAAEGDLSTDAHHTVEDVGLALGRAVDEALGERNGIVRMADATVPMDEALACVALDLSGRGYAVLEAAWTGERIGELPADLIGHLLWSFASEGKLTLHARVLSGVNDHHKAEALFKALGRALGSACRLDSRVGGAVPSTKGKLKT